MNIAPKSTIEAGITVVSEYEVELFRQDYRTEVISWVLMTRDHARIKSLRVGAIIKGHPIYKNDLITNFNPISRQTDHPFQEALSFILRVEEGDDLSSAWFKFEMRDESVHIDIVVSQHCRSHRFCGNFVRFNYASHKIGHKPSETSSYHKYREREVLAG